MRRKNQICLLFEAVPEGTHFRKGAYSWVDVEDAEEYMEKGYAKEYDPQTKETNELEYADLSDIPDELPGREHFIEAGLEFDDVMELYRNGDLQEVDQIGPSTETRIKNYFN